MSSSEGDERTVALRGVDVEMFLKRGILDINREEEELDEEDDDDAEEEADASLARELTLVSEEKRSEYLPSCIAVTTSTQNVDPDRSLYLSHHPLDADRYMGKRISACMITTKRRG